MVYTLAFQDVAMAATKDLAKTLAAVIAPNTAGIRAKILQIGFGLSGDTVQDRAYGFALFRVSDDLASDAGSPGTAVAAASIKKHDAHAPDSTCSGGLNYGTEPTYESGQPLWAMELNGRNSIIETWAEDEAPVVHYDQLIGLVAYPRSADSADTVSGFITFKVF